MNARLGAAIAVGTLAVLVAWALVNEDGIGPRGSEPLTAPARLAAFGTPSQPVKVWAIGDGASGSPSSALVAAMVARDAPDRVLYLGDVYESGTAAEFRSRVKGPYARLLDRTLPTPGNHDWGGHRKGYDPFWESVTKRPTPPWYAVRLGGWDVISLNSEAPHDARSAQVRWLEHEIRGPGTCRLAFWHRPRFSGGLHGDQGDVQPLWHALAGRAALVLNGHDHDFQRMRSRDGIVEIVSGAGGKSHYRVDTGHPGIAVSDDVHYGGLRLELRPASARIEFVALGGQVLDRSVVRCRP
jgi:hypothetical protein